MWVTTIPVRSRARVVARGAMARVGAAGWAWPVPWEAAKG
jgi:hypothetical protein